MLTEYDLHLLHDEPISDFVALIELVEDEGEAFTITRLGKPVAVVLSVDEYERLRTITTPIAGLP